MLSLPTSTTPLSSSRPPTHIVSLPPSRHIQTQRNTTTTTPIHETVPASSQTSIPAHYSTILTHCHARNSSSQLQRDHGYVPDASGLRHLSHTWRVTHTCALAISTSFSPYTTIALYQSVSVWCAALLVNPRLLRLTLDLLPSLLPLPLLRPLLDADTL